MVKVVDIFPIEFDSIHKDSFYDRQLSTVRKIIHSTTIYVLNGRVETELTRFDSNLRFLLTPTLLIYSFIVTSSFVFISALIMTVIRFFFSNKTAQ